MHRYPDLQTHGKLRLVKWSFIYNIYSHAWSMD